MTDTGNKPPMQLIDIEAYALPSSSYVANDSHCFVVTTDRKTCWRNKGGGWDDSRTRTLAAKTQAFKEWLFEFVPPDNLDKCGLDFNVNGVCHTYANRELLIGKSDASAWKAAKDYVCVFFFGKYGYGLDILKEKLRASYRKVTESCSDPYNALDMVLKRVDNYLDDEYTAWCMVCKEYVHIPVDEILAKNPSGGRAEARRRLTALIEQRESIYKKYLNGEFNTSGLRNRILNLIQDSCDDYLRMLTRIRYITSSEQQTYSANLRSFLRGYYRALAAQEEAIQNNGVLDYELLL